jgi:hypothetical protein
VSDKNKWAILFLLLREAGTKDGGSLCFDKCRGSVRVGGQQATADSHPDVSVPSRAGICFQFPAGKKESWLSFHTASH